jgi:prepilin peptidase CpaA
VLTLISGAWNLMRRQRGKIAVPYGVAIAMAGLWVLGTNYLPVSSAGGLG